MAAGAQAEYPRAAQTDAYVQASFFSETLIYFQFLNCILFSALFLAQCSSFYSWTNAQHVPCSLFIHIFILSLLSLYWFWFPRWRKPPSLQVLSLPSHCQQGRVNTVLVLILILCLTTEFYYCNILFVLHRKPNLKIKSKLYAQKYFFLY